MCIKNCIETKFTVYFEAPFWVGVCERIYENQLEVAKIVFGVEPKDYEIYDFVLHEWSSLHFSKPVVLDGAINATLIKHLNPKRMQRQINNQLSQTGIGTKAQQAMQQQHEQNKVESQKRSRLEHDFALQRKFELKQAKRKQKHKGH